MRDTPLLLCTDMDRTIIPNGAQPEPPRARENFAAYCAQPHVTLAYVTGRDRGLVQQAIAEYDLPTPDYAITDVGTIIYQIDQADWSRWTEWEAEIDRDWPEGGRDVLVQALDSVSGLRLQEPDKQNTHKVSYYVPDASAHDSIRPAIQQALDQRGFRVNVIWSVDEESGTGLIDLLPVRANKRHAIEFLQQQLGVAPRQVVFAGDSGNDLPVLISPIQSVLVGNAAPDVRVAAETAVQESNLRDSLYVADAYYAGGVLEGVAHFMDKDSPGA